MTQNLRSFLAFDTTPFPADGQTRHLFIKNDWGGIEVYLRQTVIWMGMDKGGQGDFWVTLLRVSDDSVLDFTNWDHYAEPTAPHNLIRRFDPHYMLLADQDSLRLDFGAMVPGGCKAHVVVRAWWTATP